MDHPPEKEDTYFKLLRARSVLTPKRCALVEKCIQQFASLPPHYICTRKQRKRPHESETEREDTEQEDTDTPLNDEEWKLKEEDATNRINLRNKHSDDLVAHTENVISQELNNIANYILECEAFELSTNSKSSWTLKKITYQISELRKVLLVNYQITIDPNLLYAFADRIFIGQRKHLRNSFLFQFLRTT